MKKILNFIAATLFVISGAVAQTDINAKNNIALNGYDVVSYFNGTPIKGTETFSVKYEGTTFYFASEENLDKFEGAPKNFLPQYGGYCAYAVAVKSKKVPVNPETFEIKNGKLYLFYNRGNTNTLELWKNENPKELAKKADANWGKIGKK